MKEIRYGTRFYAVTVSTFVIPFYYRSCSGSTKAKSYGSGFETLHS